jgi:hypothetical protein
MGRDDLCTAPAADPFAGCIEHARFDERATGREHITVDQVREPWWHGETV